jgi:hypothetical protein
MRSIFQVECFSLLAIRFSQYRGLMMRLSPEIGGQKVNHIKLALNAARYGGILISA